MRAAAFCLGFAFLAGAAPACAAEGGVIESGEHEDFSRIVLRVDPTTQWSLETGAGSATIAFPGRTLDFSTAGVFDLIPRDRIADVRVETDEAGTRVVVGLGCDCRISTLFVGARYLAVDVADRDAPPPPMGAETHGDPDAAAIETAEDPEARRKRETALVSSAETALLRQLERAANQGLIALTAPRSDQERSGLRENYPDFADTTPPVPPSATDRSDSTIVPMLPGSQGTQHGAAPDYGQIRATTVFDRYSDRAVHRLTEPAVPLECVPDEKLDLANWSSGNSLFEQLPALRRRVIGEFDAPDPAVVGQIARLYVRFGFGAEAEEVLASYPVPVPDRPLLKDLARAVEGQPVSPYGPLARQSPCPGAHGLWLAIGGAAPAFHDPEHFATVQAAFAALPPDLRSIVGPQLVGRLLDAGRAEDARMIADIVAGPGGDPGADMALAEARLAAAEGAPREAVASLSAMVDANTPNTLEALRQLAEIALQADFKIPDRVVTDLRGATVLYRGTSHETALRALLARALASRNELAAAIDEIRTARADPEVRPQFDTIAVAILAAADPTKVGPSVYARVMLASADLIAERPENDGPRQTIAARLLDLGLPQAAEAVVLPAAGRHPAGRLLLARAYLDQSLTDKALRILTNLEGPMAAQLRSRAHLLDGDFEAAQAELEAAGLDAEASALAWPAGDWHSARRARDPAQAMMARYMATRNSEEDQISASEYPAELSEAEAFVEPLPRLEPASLDAARRLLATSNQLEQFIQSLLAPEVTAER